MRFADYFFDGIFVDFAVMDHISNSAEQVQAVHARISDVLERAARNAKQDRDRAERDQGAGGRACAQSVKYARELSKLPGIFYP